MRKIRNLDRLTDHGDVESRRLVLTIAERTLDRLDAYNRIKSIMSFDGRTLTVGTRSWDLDAKRNVYLVGAGKACNAMARAVDEVLGDRLTRGIAIVKVSEETDVFNRTEVYVGGHPGPNDLFVGVVSGGSSALMSCPIQGISLQDEMDATDVLLKSGAGIYEVNAVRRHISQTNGGMLAKRIAAVGAELIGFGISDAVGSPPTGDIGIPYAQYKSTPFGPDQTTLDDARAVIRNYDLADRLPRSIVEYFDAVGEEGETPKAFPNNTYFLINTLPDSCRYAKEIAGELRVKALVLTSFLEGESADAGTFMAALAREIQAYGNPVAPPVVLLSSGETTTTILDNSVLTGHGGPSQELTAAFAIAAAKTEGACMFSIDSEGTDGTTSVAGGITDSRTLAAAKSQGVSLHAALRGHACYEALDRLGDTVFTGNTGTNLCDFNILYIPAVRK